MDPTTVLSTFLNVKAMVTDILKAREELTKMPDNTKSLLDLVDCADKALEKLHPAASDLGGSESDAGMIYSPHHDKENELLRPFLFSLGKELLRVHGILEKFQRKSGDVAARNKVWETGKAYFGLGAARQNKRISEICDSIRSLLSNLNQVIIVEDHGTLVNLHQIVSRGQRDHQSPGGQSRAPFPDLVSKLEHLAWSCLDDETCCVDVEIAPSHNNEFRPPGAEERKAPVTGGSEDNRRGAREGGYEISNFTKVRFRISVPGGERFLNVIIFDNWLNTPPELFFPKSTSANTKLTSTDPLSLKLEKSSTQGTETVAMQSIYVVLSPEQLQLKDNAKVFTLEDLKLHLDNEDIFVKHFPFDIK
ncbi:hypothetical protein BDL97_14G089100 [Sphagnum fallax]|nr:hypothetical protein BDL97_14G089100 [Sphagnum fallax]